MMKWSATIWLLLICSGVTNNGYSNDINENNNSLIWQISGKHLNKPSYLFGTMHIICADDYVWTKGMSKSLEKSDAVCFEMNLADPQIVFQIAAGLSDNQKDLHNYFNDEEYALLKNYIKDTLGMDIAIFEHVKPVMLETMLDMKNINCTESVSYEEKIMSDAQKSNKKIDGLEAPQEQIALLEKIPADSAVKDIMAIIKGKNKTEDDEFPKLVAAYKRQDLPELYRLLKGAKIPGEDIAPLVDDRNKKWIPRMEERMEQESVFFAVGAGHLWGDNGLINLLRKEGYKVVPVK